MQLRVHTYSDWKAVALAFQVTPIVFYRADTNAFMGLAVTTFMAVIVDVPVAEASSFATDFPSAISLAVHPELT